MRKVFIAVFLLLTFNLQAQPIWRGFFRPHAGLEAGDLSRGGGSYDFYIRPAASMTAIQFSWNKEEKQFNSSQFSSAGIGLGIQHYAEHDGRVVNNYGLNALVILEASQGTAGIGVALTINALQFVNLGAGYSFTGKKFFLLTGAIYNF